MGNWESSCPGQYQEGHVGPEGRILCATCGRVCKRKTGAMNRLLPAAHRRREPEDVERLPGLPQGPAPDPGSSTSD